MAIQENEPALLPNVGNLPDASRQAQLERLIAWFSVGIPALGFVIAVVWAALYGIGVMEITLLAGMYLITALGVEAGMHRFFSHRAFQAGPGVTALLGISGSMAAQGPILFWVASHRKHHAFTDHEGDPHSPRRRGSGLRGTLAGLWHAHIGWLFRSDPAPWSRYAQDLLRNRQVVRLNHYYPLWVLLGLALPALIGGLWAGSLEGAWLGFLWGGLVRIFLVDQVTWSINSLAHSIGARTHQTRCNSRNLWALALLSMGGAWHNNHHANPTRYRTDEQPWQLDPSGWFIRTLARIGIAWNLRDNLRDKQSGQGKSGKEDKGVAQS